MNQRIPTTDSDGIKLANHELEGQYQAALGSGSDKAFFLSIYSYIRYLHSNQLLETPVLDYIQSKHDMALKAFIELDQKLVKEIDSAHKMLIAYLDENEVSNPLITEKRERYRGYKNGSIDSDGGTQALRHQIDDILYELDRLDRARHGKFLSKFGQFHPKHNFLDLTYLDSERKWSEEKNRIDRIKHAEIWYWWWELEEIYQLISRYEEAANEAVASNKVVAMLGSAMRYQELMKLIKGDISVSSLLNRDDYITYLTQFNLEIQRFLTSQIRNSNPAKTWQVDIKDIKLKARDYDVDDSTLYINSQPIRIQLQAKGRGDRINEIMQAKVMRRLFSVKTFPHNIEFYRIIPVAKDRMNAKMQKSIENAVTDINNKINPHVKDKEQYPDLVRTSQLEVFIDAHYLSK